MKGQGALEYLMTYGWALLVIVVVGAALFALGVLNPTTYTQARCNGLQYFTYQSHKLNATHFAIEILNGPRQVNITDMDIGTIDLDLDDGSPDYTMMLSAGARGTLMGSGSLSSIGSTGDSFSEDITITYDFVGGITSNIDSATCIGSVQ